ncbi:helix-turn-helix domain-containing protein [Deinococcus altitudinis]|uniref:helix-turn-helix domain-containing protein n=1 Tax=Deinococcus altitudinis TaxID=468914 RepID=UPI00389228E9
MPETFGERLREARKRRNLNQYELAELVLGNGARQAEVSRWESGTVEPTSGNLTTIVRVLNVSADELLGTATIIEPTSVLA